MSRSKIAIITVILLIIAGAVYFFFMRNQGAGKTAETEITPTSNVSEASPTPEEVDPGEYDIEILNGSGIAGEAGRAQELLESEDYTVVSTGNADEFDYTDTVIQASDEVSEDWLDDLKDILGRNYTVQSSVEDLDTDSEADVVIIVGSLDENGDSMASEEDTETTPEPTSAEGDEEPTESPTATPEPTGT